MFNSTWFKALQGNYRYPTNKGNLNTEQLFTVDYATLKALYIKLQKEAREFLGVETLDGEIINNETLLNKIKLVKKIYTYRTHVQAQSLRDQGNRVLAEKLLKEADIKEVKELTKGKTSQEIREEVKNLLN